MDMEMEMERMKIEMEWRDAWNFEEDVDEKERQERAARAASAFEKEVEREGLGRRSRFTKQWEEHESEWKRFTSTTEQPVILTSIPWPPCPSGLLSGMASVMLGASEDRKISIYDAHRKAYKMASLRWHPDKFLHKFGSQLERAEREEILKRGGIFPERAASSGSASPARYELADPMLPHPLAFPAMRTAHHHHHLLNFHIRNDFRTEAPSATSSATFSFSVALPVPPPFTDPNVPGRLHHQPSYPFPCVSPLAPPLRRLCTAPG
eukprot:scaffold786_cov329-Pavlova_lutheri.AAC.10